MIEITPGFVCLWDEVGAGVVVGRLGGSCLGWLSKQTSHPPRPSCKVAGLVVCGRGVGASLLHPNGSQVQARKGEMCELVE